MTGTSPADAVVFRDATPDDLPAIVALLSDDFLGAARDGAPDPAELAPYRAAFERMMANGQQIVVGTLGARVVATCELAILPGLSARGRIRGQIEAVRVAADLRSAGLGARLMAEAERRLRAAGCGVMQLTTDKRREAAHRFYDRLGFTPSHIGYKRQLNE